MINNIKTFAIAILAAGATATAMAATDTNTFTNVIQDVSITLTVYSNSPTKSATSIGGGKPVQLTTKTIIAALSNDSANIPSLVGFDWGKSPQLVINTTFSHTNTPIYTTNVVVSNTILLSSSNNDIAFQSTNSAVTSGTNVAIISTNGYAVITNNTVGTNGGTNVLTVHGTWTDSASSVSTTNFAYLGTNGLTNLSAGFPTNVGVWTVITATTNSSGTNVTAVTYTNFVSGTETNYLTNKSNIEIEGGTPASPTFADVSDYVSSGTDHFVTNSATGTDFDTTNADATVATGFATKSFNVTVFSTTAGTAVGNNLDVRGYGFAKVMYDLDYLLKSKKLGTNDVPETTSSTLVTGSGYIGGSYVTNNQSGNSIYLPATEYTGIGSVTNTNYVDGSITNPVPVVFEGTISVGAPKSVPQ